MEHIAYTEEYERFFSLSTDLMCIYSTSGFYLKVNEAWEKALGYSPNEMEGHHFRDFVLQDDWESTATVVENLLDNQDLSGFLNRYRHKNGSIRFLQWKAIRREKIVYGVARDVTEQHLAEQQLRASKARYQALLDSTNNVNILVSPTYEIILLNVAAKAFIKRLWGIDAKEGDSMLQYILISPESFKEVFHTALEGKMVVSEKEIEMPGLGKQWFLFRRFAVYEDSEKPLGVAYNIANITEQKLAENALKASEASLRRAQNTAKIGSWEFNLRANQLYWSKEHYNIFELEETPADMLYEAYRRKIHPEDIPLLDSVMDKMMQDGKGFTYHHRVCCNDGGIKYVVGICEVEKDEEGRPFILHGTVQDISESKKTEVALMESQSFANSIINNIPLMLFVKEASTLRFVEFNKAGEKLTGFKREELLGKNDHDFFPKEEADFFMKKDWEALQEQRLINIEEETLHTRDGGSVLLHTRKMPILDWQGQPKYLLGISEDITELRKKELALAEKHRQLQASEEALRQRTKTLMELNDELRKQRQMAEIALLNLKKAQGQLVQSEKMASLGLLTAGVAHEINNPINYIFGGIQGLEPIVNTQIKLLELYSSLCNESDSEKAKDLKDAIQKELDDNEGMSFYALSLVDSIKDGASRVAGIVQSLRNFSRTDENRTVRADMHEIIDSTLMVLQSKIKGRISIVKKYAPSLPAIECFPGQLSQVFMNLVDNAIDAIPDEGTISISTVKKAGHVEIVISDSGVGVPKQFVSKIFDPFFTTKEVGRGTGLGLSIVHGIVEKHRGNIYVHSEEGKGTTFTIIIPLE